MRRPARLGTLAAMLLTALCVAAAEPTPDIKDAYGPLGYEPPGQFSMRKLRGGLIAAGFCTAGFYWIVRRRRRVRRRMQATARATLAPPDERVLELEPGEFYAHLAALLREALARACERNAAARTPRAMRDAAPAQCAQPERWQAFWTRAERAEYAAVAVPEDERRADLAFVAELLARLHAAGARGGGNAV